MNGYQNQWLQVQGRQELCPPDHIDSSHRGTLRPLPAKCPFGEMLFHGQRAGIIYIATRWQECTLDKRSCQGPFLCFFHPLNSARWTANGMQLEQPLKGYVKHHFNSFKSESSTSRKYPQLEFFFSKDDRTVGFQASHTLT